jgi:ribosomal protein L29
MSIKADKELVGTLSIDALKSSVEVLRQSLFQHRMSVLTHESQDTSKIRFIRKQIARRLQQVSTLNSAELITHA